MKPFRCEIYNLRTKRTFLKSQGGYISTLSAVCDKDAQEEIEALPETGNYQLIVIPQEIVDEHGEAVERVFRVLENLSFEVKTPDTVYGSNGEQIKPDKGEYGQFWRWLIGKGFFNHPTIREWTEENRASIKSSTDHVLRSTFGVASLSFVSPDEMRRMFPWAEPMIAQAERLANEQYT